MLVRVSYSETVWKLCNFANVDDQQDGNQQTQNCVGLYHCCVDHRFGNFVWSFCYNIDTGSSYTALMDTGDQTGQCAWQASSQNVHTLGSGQSSIAAEESAVEHNHDADQEAVDTLCTRKSLQNQGLTEFVRVLCNQSGSSLTGNAYALCRADTDQTNSQSCTKYC